MRREESPDDLLTSAEAALIISRNSRREIKPSYLNQLVRQGRLTPHKLDARTNLYRRGDIEKIVVSTRGRKSQRQSEGGGDDGGRGRVCVICGRDFLAFHPRASSHVCVTCMTPRLRKEEVRYRMQMRRSRTEKVVSALTFDEWLKILNHFQWKCAYCQVKEHALMEHIISIRNGGGTEASNVVPACIKCNSHKDRTYPIMKPGEIERVRLELVRAFQPLTTVTNYN